MSKKTWIPKVSEEEIKKLAEKIKPVFQFDRGRCFIQPVNLFTTAYTWDPKPADGAKDLKIICDIVTYHTYGFYGFFKPSIAEVLAQIPKDLREKVIAFEIIEKPESANDLNRHHEALNAGYHVAKTRLYTWD